MNERLKRVSSSRTHLLPLMSSSSEISSAFAGRVSKDEAAAKRAKNAEAEKNADEVAKQKKENCLAAKANLKTHTVGGRIARTNANGERENLSDADIKKGIVDSQADIDKYCDE